MKKFTIGVGLLLYLFTNNIIAQGELDEQSQIFYRNERTFALLVNSTGFGLNYRFGKRMTAFKHTIYDADFVWIKHPREQKIQSDSYYFRRIVYGKLNEFYNLRIGLGLQNEMFSKIDRGGISIRRYFTFGPSFGFTKPIYYNIDIIGSNGLIQSTTVAKFSEQHVQPSRISGKASFFKGFDEIAVIPGLHGKVGFMFEFGKVDAIIHAIDAGIVVDAFIKKAEIMATEDNKQIFLTLFASYRFGKVLDARFKNNRKNKADEVLTQ